MRNLTAILSTTLLCALAVLVASLLYQQGSTPPRLPAAQESGELVVLTVSGPTTYYEDAVGRLVGPEYDLATMFAAELKLRVRFQVVPNDAALIAGLEAGRGHVGAAALSPTVERERRVRFGPAYQMITPQVVYRDVDPRPGSLADLRGKSIAVLARGHHAEQLAERSAQAGGLSWLEFDGESTDDLLRRLSDGGADAAVVDSNWLALSRYLYPNIEVAFDLTRPAPLAWAFPLAGNDALYRSAKTFFARVHSDGTIKQVLARYYGGSRRPAKIDVAAFLEHIEDSLSRYRQLFQHAQEVSGIDWRLIAAISYQESHWDPLATSPTGVRGLMMLTEETAERMKVKDRLDPKESTVAGSRYLALLKEGIPERIDEPDRTWLAIAAYNQGLGHLQDARVLTQRLKRNADAWADVKVAMPLLSNPLHHETLKHGYARGGEAVAMTENVRTFYDILLRLEKPHRKVLAVEQRAAGDEFMASP